MNPEALSKYPGAKPGYKLVKEPSGRRYPLTSRVCEISPIRFAPAESNRLPAFEHSLFGQGIDRYRSRAAIVAGKKTAIEALVSGKTDSRSAADCR